MHYVKNNDIKDRKKISKITNRKKKLENILKYQYQYRRKKTIRLN